ncbi:hypothetical protein JG688_00017782 [Phytophthora aleatoria]|uniref:HAT C-terminal dimerisation domain-containing protein n=1 Tax=Phytophthora aleatoria TaxID=2496075 RepID=A0A8J5IWT6_9STRA|nr:hypothetical protein JG688_00017782 [Phytophthora aleatoria]
MHGTSASVERLFSSVKYVMTKHRNQMTPVLFKVIMFLKTNRPYWDSRLVAKAIKSAYAVPEASA